MLSRKQANSRTLYLIITLSWLYKGYLQIPTPPRDNRKVFKSATLSNWKDIANANRLLKSNEVATLLHVGLNLAYDLTLRGGLVAIHYGKSIRVIPEELKKR